MNAHASTFNPPGSPRVWQRYSMGQRLLRFALYLLVVAAIVQAIRGVEIIPEFLYDAPEQMADLCRWACWRPTTSRPARPSTCWPG
jgi:phosphonate transport system permease protein